MIKDLLDFIVSYDTDQGQIWSCSQSAGILGGDGIFFLSFCCEKYGDAALSVLDKYMLFSGFCTMPWRMRSPIRVFISVRLVSIQLLARNCYVKLGCA